MNPKPKHTFLDRFAKKDLKRKQSYELPQSVLDLIGEYVSFGKTNGVDVNPNELVAEAVRDFVLRDRDFQARPRDG